MDDRSDLLDASADWPLVEITQQRSDDAVFTRRLNGDRARFPLLGGGSVLIERDPPLGRYEVPELLSADELVHPYLVPVAAVHAYWRGHLAFHAGGVVVNGKAWGVLGAKSLGKSTLLALLASRGQSVIADDLLVVSDGHAFAGPRTIDLRPESLEAVRDSVEAELTSRGRWRLRIGPIDPVVDLGGWLFLKWGQETRVRRMGAEALENLARILTVKLPPQDPVALLRLAPLPSFEFSRPKEMHRLSESVELLLDVLGDAA